MQHLQACSPTRCGTQRTRSACVAEETRSFLDRLFGGTLRPLVAHCAEHHSLTKKDVAELKALLDQIKPKS